MKKLHLHLKSALFFILNFLQLQNISGSNISSRNGALFILEEIPDRSDLERWTCSCASGLPGMQSSALSANCSTACNCRPEVSPDGSTMERSTCLCDFEGVTEALNHINDTKCFTSCNCTSEVSPDGSTMERSTCLCDFEGVTEALNHINDTKCFTSCNCTSGSSRASKVSRKHISNKVVVYVLLVCVIFTTVALLASVACYIYRKDKFSVQPPMFSADKNTSFNSFTNLISHGSAPTPEIQVSISSRLNPITGCIYRTSFLLKNKIEIIPGNIIKFSYSELEQATDKFSNANLIGLGGSSSVYHGQLKDGRAVAVKRLKAWGGPDTEFGFLTEVELISRLHHCHIVSLLGFCSESHGRHVERLQVFEYMPNGNLRDCLDLTHGKEPIEWVTRVNIALGAARGLEYLHEAAAPRILHRDVKSSNILLDNNWRAKITDLGMAKCLTTEGVNSCSNSPARMLGTFGYFAPEYAIIGKASPKSDVFSFGVVLLELISGRRPINNSSKEKKESLVIWATPLLQNNKRVVTELADPLLKDNFPEKEMLIMAQLAGHCLNVDPELRPTMTEVVQILSTITPNKSRRNFPINYFQLQSSSHRSLKDLDQLEEKELQVIHDSSNYSINTVQLEPMMPRLSLPLAVDRDLCASSSGKEEQPELSAERIGRLILLASKARSLQSHDEEVVDLTEPRFEKFWQANVRSL